MGNDKPTLQDRIEDYKRAILGLARNHTGESFDQEIDAGDLANLALVAKDDEMLAQALLDVVIEHEGLIRLYGKPERTPET